MSSPTISPPSIAIPTRSQQLLALIPGTLLLFAIGLTAKALESLGLLLRAHHHFEHKALFLWQNFPKFILGFIALSILATLGFFTPSQLNSLSNLSKWAFLPAFAGVGLRTHLRDLVHQGWRPILVGILGEIFIALLTLAMVLAVYPHAPAR